MLEKIIKSMPNAVEQKPDLFKVGKKVFALLLEKS